MRLGARAGRRVRARPQHAPRHRDATSDLVACAARAEPTSEQFALFRRYIDARHADGGMADMTVLDYAMMVEDSVINTFVTEYRREAREPAADASRRSWPLVGGRAVRPASPTASRWSTASTTRRRRGAGLGTYMILEHIAYARQLGAALPLPRLLDHRLAQDELQDALPAAGAARPQRLGAEVAARGFSRNFHDRRLRWTFTAPARR